MLIWLFNLETQVGDILFLSENIVPWKESGIKINSVSFYICLFRDAGIMVLSKI